MTHQELREKYLSFFEARGHKRIPSAPLIPENDATVLFTTAGMHPLVPFLLGEKHPAGDKLTSCQKCVRTGDIEEVGDDVHLTFFEMLGNWGLGGPASTRGGEPTRGGYWKKEAIEWSWEFLTKELNLPMEKLAVSVFAGDSDAPFDEESYNLWKGLGISEKRIIKLPKANNWWGPAGQTGPCGPDTEMFYWTGDGDAPKEFDANDIKWVEIWNDVFMQYNKTAQGTYEPLKQKNVDTGMGLERVLAILNGKKDVYETDVLFPLMKAINENTNSSDLIAKRIIADHIRAAVFIITDGVLPSNTERGYILRRLLRRAEYYFNSIGGTITIWVLAQQVLDIYKNTDYVFNAEVLKDVILEEEKKFRATILLGKKQFEKFFKKDEKISGKNAFILYSTFGYPIELTQEMAKENGMAMDIKDIEESIEEMKKHQELSRTASAGMFKGGMADNSEMVVKYHTTTHLLHAVLRKVLGQEVEQKGSNLNAERLRFDFSYGQKMTPEQIKQVEDIINEKIQEKLNVKMEEMSLEDAKKSGAIGLFAEKYGDKVKVYSIGDFSKEICGGPHVGNIGTLGHFKIIKEEAVSAGVRRIKAVLE